MIRVNAIAIPTEVRDQAVVLGGKLLPSGIGAEKVRVKIWRFIKEQGYAIKLDSYQIDSIMQMADAVLVIHIKAYNDGYAIAKAEVQNEMARLSDLEENPDTLICMSRSAVIDVLVDAQIDSFMSSNRVEQEQLFRDGFLSYDDYDDDILIEEYNDLVDECNQIDEIVE